MSLKKEIVKRLLSLPGVEEVTVEKVYHVHIKGLRQFRELVFEEEKRIIMDYNKESFDFDMEYLYRGRE